MIVYQMKKREFMNVAQETEHITWTLFDLCSNFERLIMIIIK